MRRRLQIEQLSPRICFALGVVDPYFGNAGEYSVSYDQAKNVNESLVQSFDIAGGVLLVMTAQAGSGPVITLAMRNEQGAADLNFGDRGQVRIVDQNFRAGVAQAIRLSTGTLLLRSSGSWEYSSVIALHPDGSLVTDFGDGGFLRFPFELSAYSFELVAGTAGDFFRLDYQALTNRLTKFDQYGRVDASFGTNGTISFPRTANLDAQVNPGGDITLAGLKFTNNIARLAVYHFLPDGTPDESFGNSGVQFSPEPVIFSYPQLSSDSRSVFLLTNRAATSEGAVYRIEKFTSAATPDVSFGGTGFVDVQTSIITQLSQFRNLVVDEQGSAYLNIPVSWPAQSYVLSLFTYKLKANGSVDETYGQNGAVVNHVPLQAPPYKGTILDVRLDDAGNLLWSSSIDPYFFQNHLRDLVVVKVFADGTLDKDWGVGGVVSEDFTIASQTLQRLEFQPLNRGGMRVLSGWPPFGGTGFDVGRADALDASGALVETAPFKKGTSVVSSPSVNGGWYTAQQNSYLTSLVVRKFLSDGTPDSSFGAAGALTVAAEFMYDITMHTARDGSVVIAAGAGNDQDDTETSPGVGLVVRLTAEGALDARFGTGGILRIYNKPGQLVDVMHDNALGTVLVFTNGGSVSFQAFGPDGQLRNTFGTNGTLKLNKARSWKDSAIDEQGRILALTSGGTSLAIEELQLRRIEVNGTLSPGFGNGGSVILPIDYSAAFDTASLAVRHGVIVVAATHQLEDARIRLVALDYGGHTLAELGPGGVRDIDFAAYGESVQDLQFADDGSLWLAAFARQEFDMTGKVVRLLGSETPTAHNWDDALDVNADDFLSPLDALLVISVLNGLDAAAGSFPDTNGDTQITALDALLVINRLNSQLSSEGEAAAQASLSAGAHLPHAAAIADGYFEDIAGFDGHNPAV